MLDLFLLHYPKISTRLKVVAVQDGDVATRIDVPLTEVGWINLINPQHLVSISFRGTDVVIQVSADTMPLIKHIDADIKELKLIKIKWEEIK